MNDATRMAARSRARAGIAALALFTALVADGASAWQWAQTYGGGGGESDALAVQPTADGGFVVAGTTYAFGSGNGDAWVLKLDARGGVEWQRTYGGTLQDGARAIRATSDGGYLVAGQANASGTVSGDAWLLRLDRDGAVAWQKTYRYAANVTSEASDVLATPDGGYLVVGQAYARRSFGNPIADAWVLKLDADGGVVWQGTHGGRDGHFATSVTTTPDDGYVVAGHSFAPSAFGALVADAWVMKLDAKGVVAWQRTYGGTGGDVARSVRAASAGGYVVVGSTSSFGSSGDAWVLRLDEAGGVRWQNAYRVAGADGAYAIAETGDRGFAIAGSGGSIMKIDGAGNAAWARTYAGVSDVARAVAIVPGGDLVVAGRAARAGGVAAVDAWVLRLDPNGAIRGCASMTTVDAVVRATSAVSAVGNALPASSAVAVIAGSALVRPSAATPVVQCRFAVANYQGLWWAAPPGSESGWGINFAHQQNVIFATWYTYDRTGRAWWLTMTAQKGVGETFAGDVYATTGPRFDAVPFDPATVTRREVGNASLAFDDADNGTFAYTVDGVSRTKRIVRQAFGPLPECEWAAQPDLAAATNYQDLWWAAPAGSESGWGTNFAHEGDTIFATWFTYDVDGAPLWLSATAPRRSTGDYAGTLYRTSGPPFDAQPFDPDAVTRTAVGTLTLSFADGNAATFTYDVTLPGSPPVTQSKAVTRQVFRPPGTACR